MAGRGFGVRKIDQSDRYQPTSAHSPLEQCKRHILENCLPLVRAEHKEMIIPCYMQDTDDYRQALELEEIKQAIASKKLEKVTRYVENNMGALVGNTALGFFLGMAGFFGKIFGIPFDIRHITIASGNSAMAYYTTGNTPGHAFLLTVFAGILLIGLFNFLVSFALAFFVAVRSRGVRLRDYPQLAAVVTKFFIKFPVDFVFPPKHPREIADVKRKFRFKRVKFN